MNEVWNLDPIYPGFNSPEFRQELADLKDTVADFASWVETLEGIDPLEGLKTGTDYLEKLLTYGNKLVEYCMLRQAANTLDAEATSGASQVMGILSTMAGPKAVYKDWASKLPNLMELVESDDVLREYTFLYRNIQDSSCFQLSGRGEEIMAKMELSGGSGVKRPTCPPSATWPMTLIPPSARMPTRRSSAATSALRIPLPSL